MTIAAQQSLNNFYRSVQFSNPRLADRMSDDVEIVALNALGADKSKGQVAADRLRQYVYNYNLPELHRRVLDNALTELGYS